MPIDPNHMLSCIEIDPPTPAKRAIIWMHGLGADGSDFAPIVPELRLAKELGIRFVFPHAPVIPVTINNGYQMRAWYDILAINLDREIDQRGIQQSIQQIHSLIQNEIAKGISSDNIILAGFSQGAVMALSAGLQSDTPLGGIIALSGYLPSADWLQNASAANKNIPIFLGHGIQDPVVPFVLGTAAKEALVHAGYPVSWHSYPMGHSVCGEEIHDIGRWIEGIWK